MPERDAEWNLNAKDNTGSATRSAADGFEKLGREADKAQRKMDDVGDEAVQLSAKLKLAQIEAARLARSFANTGDTKLYSEFRKTSAEAAKLGKLMKAIKFDPAADDRGGGKKLGVFASFLKTAQIAGEEGGKLTIKSLTAAFEALPGPAKAALVGAVVGGASVAAPLIAATISGAVLSGVAGAGLVGGLVLATRDPRVAEAYGNMGQRILQRLQETVGKPFAATLLQGSDELEAAFNRQAPRIGRIASTLAADLKPIITYAIAAVEKIMPSIERASAAGGRILKDVFAQLPGLTSAVGRLLDAFASGGRGAGDALVFLVGQLSTLLNLLAFGARVSAPMLNLLGTVSEFLHLVPKASDETAHWHNALDASATSAASAAMTYEDLAQSMGNTANQAKALNDAFSRLFGTQLSVDQANLAVNTGMAQLTETIRGNKKTLDQSTEAGRQNTGAILNQLDALNRKREADIAAGNGTAAATAKANAAYAAQVESLRGVLYQLGLTKGQVDALIDAYSNIPKSLTTTITTVYRTQGVKPGQSDQATGHSRTGANDYSVSSNWYPAAFAGASRSGFVTAAAGAGGGYQPPLEVTSDLQLTVELDGAPFRSQAARVTRAAERRQAWRAYVGGRK